MAKPCRPWGVHDKGHRLSGFKQQKFIPSLEAPLPASGQPVPQPPLCVHLLSSLMTTLASGLGATGRSHLKTLNFSHVCKDAFPK